MPLRDDITPLPSQQMPRCLSDTTIDIFFACLFTAAITPSMLHHYVANIIIPPLERYFRQRESSGAASAVLLV